MMYQAGECWREKVLKEMTGHWKVFQGEVTTWKPPGICKDIK